MTLLEEVLLDLKDTRSVFESAGFRIIASEVILQTISPDWESYADKIAAGGDSVLARLSNEEFDIGLNAIRAHAANTKNKTVNEPIDLLPMMLRVLPGSLKTDCFAWGFH